MTVQAVDIEALFRAHYPEVHRFVYRFVQDEGTADDLAQEVFLKAYRAAGTYRGDASQRTWVFRIARNVCIDWLRSPRSREARSESLEEAREGGWEPGTDRAVLIDAEPSLGVEGQAGLSAMRTCVQGLVEGLPETLRTPLLLHDSVGLNNREIAEVLIVSVAAAKMRLHRARQEARRMMDDNCDLFRDERNVLSCLPATPDCAAQVERGAAAMLERATA